MKFDIVHCSQSNQGSHRLEEEFQKTTPKTKTQRFINIKVMHRLNGDEPFSSKNFLHEAMIKSQLQIIDAIKRNPDCPILLQSLDENITIKDCNNELCLRAKLLFPNGIPSTIRKLNFPQKKFIYEIGAAKLMLMLSQIPTLYRTIHKSVDEELLKQAQVYTYSEAIFTKIDKEAMECAKEVLSSQQCANQDQPAVLVIFGASHDFGSLAKASGISYEILNTLQDMKQDMENDGPKNGPRFIHIKDMHRLPGKFSQDNPLTVAVVRSQLKVVETIRNFQGDFHVFTESLEKDLDIKDCDRSIVFMAHHLFPDGIPSTIDELTLSQKDFIYDYGAPDLMLFLNQIPKLYATSKKISRLMLENAIKQGDTETQFDAREEETIACVKEVFTSQEATNRGQPVALVVFGGSHDFQTLSNREGFSYEKIYAV